MYPLHIVVYSRIMLDDQSRTWQKKVIQNAALYGYEDLYWAIQVTVGSHKYLANLPGSLVPLVPVGPDPVISSEWAHLLQESIKSHYRGRANLITNPYPTLVNSSHLDALNIKWYEWGKLDIICEMCGEIGFHVCPCEGDENAN